MNIQYISGFFDADGSITLVKRNKKENKSPHIYFTNTYLNILKSIKDFLEKEYKLKGRISTKKVYNDVHNIGYSLTYSNRNAKSLCKLLQPVHPKKIHRINTINKYYDIVTIRNGRYTEKQLLKKKAFERLFFISNFLEN